MLGLFKDIISLGYYTVSPLFNNNYTDELVLLYHSVGYISRQDDQYKLNVAPLLFERHIEFLTHLKKQNIIVTFDDGFENIFDIVFPIISRYKIKVMLFVTVGFIDGFISFSDLFNNGITMKPLNWRQIKEFSDSGIEIGSHTLTHPNLLRIDKKKAYTEIKDSKKRIEDVIGKEVKYFAYPYGSKKSFNNSIKEIVKESGYEKAYTNIMGFNTKDTDLYELKRIRIYSNDNMLRFRFKINGAYNWVDYFCNL